MKPLNILISNDDGVFAAGIRALAKSAQKRGHKVKVVCPDQERSATGHGLTLQSPLRVEKADELFGEGIEAWGCLETQNYKNQFLFQAHSQLSILNHKKYLVFHLGLKLKDVYFPGEFQLKG